MSIQLIHALLGDGYQLAHFSLTAARIEYTAPKVGDGIKSTISTEFPALVGDIVVVCIFLVTVH